MSIDEIREELQDVVSEWVEIPTQQIDLEPLIVLLADLQDQIKFQREEIQKLKARVQYLPQGVPSNVHSGTLTCFPE